MELVDVVSPRDKETIKHYIQRYTDVAEPASFKQVFHVWNKEKRTLYKLLGKQLRVSFPVKVPRNQQYYSQELHALYSPWTIWDKGDINYFIKFEDRIRHDVRHDFIYEFTKFICEHEYEKEDCYNLSRLFLYNNFENGGYIATIDNDEPYHTKAFKCTIKNGMRTVRTIQKVLKAMHFNRMDLFEDWRNRISDLNINGDINANLVFSIHPIDFMTMSDNSCGWSSCMSWEHGAYSAGTIEMMNSNMAIVAYLEHDSAYNLIYDNISYPIPNKSWRSLIYINKHIMIVGKSYPYINDSLANICLDKLQELAKENLGWVYQYQNQPYRDCKNIRNNFFLKNESLYQFNRSRYDDKPKQAIYVYTNGMYNDIVEYHDMIYWCCRNHIKKTLKFCLSGKLTCMCCGNIIESPENIYGYDDIGDIKVCYNCKENHSCFICEQIYYNTKKHQLNEKYFCCSDECINDTIYVPVKKEFFSKSVLSSYTPHYFIFLKDDVPMEDTNIYERLFGITRRNFSCFLLNEKISDIMRELEKPMYKEEYMGIIPCNGFFVRDIYSIVQRKHIPIKKYVDSITLIQDRSVIPDINLYKQWIPAREVIRESRRTLSA